MAPMLTVLTPLAASTALVGMAIKETDSIAQVLVTLIMHYL